MAFSTSPLARTVYQLHKLCCLNPLGCRFLPLVSNQQTLWPAQVRRLSVVNQQLCTGTGLGLDSMPPHIILLRHGETAGLETLQEQMQVPNHRVPLSAAGVAESEAAGRAVQQLLTSRTGSKQISNGAGSITSSNSGAPRLFLYTSPFLRCIQTAQHVTRALQDDQVVGFQEEVQLREQDWGNFQEPGQQKRNYDARLKYGRFFYRFPDGESAADVYDRMTMFQDHFVRDIACKRFSGGTSVMMITHGLALRLFLMRWLHWTVDDFLQVHNPPTAAPIILSRQTPQACDNNNSSTGQPWGASKNSSSSNGDSVCPESIKSCYSLTTESLQHLRGVTEDMGAGRSISSKQQLLQWRPYLKQVPPPPAMDPEQEAALHELMERGYRSFHSSTSSCKE